MEVKKQIEKIISEKRIEKKTDIEIFKFLFARKLFLTIDKQQ